MADDDVLSEGHGIGGRPADDPLVLEVARSRIANALFATAKQVTIGRYQLLKRAGAGGMGVVWSAWDPELERRVAVKILHASSSLARDHMLAEGQALAKLSHPHIVPIYDVGTADERVYLVMEWIEGETLRALSAGPTSRKAIVESYRAAGAGLAAAHAAGIVHRDFKPDNVMVGVDRRVRILDFGIARTEQADGGVAGTPRYMAPEQGRGEAASAAADQYSFGVSLRESLRELPRWIAQLVARATAADPAARYPSMDALLAALARDPARVWRRRVLAVGLVGATAAAFAIGTRQAKATDTCGGGRAEMARVWGVPRGKEIAAHLGTLGPYAQSQVTTLLTTLGVHGDHWVLAYRGACLARKREELTTTIYERGLACLERSRAAVDGVATALSHATAAQLEDAVLASRTLPDPGRCIADATTDPIAPPPHAIALQVRDVGATTEKARFLALASDPAAGALAATVVRDAAALGYLPLVAQAQLALGAAHETEPTAVAHAAYRAAADAALAGGDDVTFVEAFARQLYRDAREGDPGLATLTSALPVISTIARRTGEAGRFARGLLYNNAGAERLAAGDIEAAEAWFRRARAEPEPPDRSAELWAVLGNLAMVVDDQTERKALFAEERARLERTLGPEHPFTLQVRLRAAMFTADAHEAPMQLRGPCDAYARLHPHRSDKLWSCNWELGWLASERGDVDDAVRAYTAALALPTDNTTRAGIAKAALARLGGDPRAAIAQAVPLAQAAQNAKTWWERVDAADAWLVVAVARTTLGDRAGAIAALEAARSIFDDPRLNLHATPLQRRHTRVVALLAIARHDRVLADRALVWYRAAGGYDAMIRALSWD